MIQGLLRQPSPGVVLPCIAALLLLPVSAWAQGTFADLQVRIKPGDTLYLTDSSGLRIKGTLASLSGSSLTLAARTRREFAASDLREIRVQHPDGLRNGALIGLAAGVGAGLLSIPIACDLPDNECATIVAVAFVPAAAGLGALSGAVIDGLIHKSSLVYRRPVTASRLSISPLVSPGRRGFSLAIRF